MLVPRNVEPVVNSIRFNVAIDDWEERKSKISESNFYELNIDLTALLPVSEIPTFIFEHYDEVFVSSLLKHMDHADEFIHVYYHESRALVLKSMKPHPTKITILY